MTKRKIFKALCVYKRIEYNLIKLFVPKKSQGNLSDSFFDLVPNINVYLQ